LRITGGYDSNGNDDVNTISKSQTQRVFDSPNTATQSGRAAENPGTSADQVDLGSQSGLLSQTQTATSDDRAGRIEQLRALVQSGQYNVDSQALSQSIVSGALDGY
jgi:flagellar biosynthesis anti-sigma factor FlgM